MMTIDYGRLVQTTVPADLALRVRSLACSHRRIYFAHP